MELQDNLYKSIIQTISENVKVILGGKDLDLQQALHIAFPKATKYESYGFKKIGNDLEIKKINYI